MEETRLKDIRKQLESAGFDTYFPGQHRGECLKPYVVVKDAGTTRLGTFSTIQYTYDIMLYVPLNRFSQLDPLMQQIRAAMKTLSSKISLRVAYDMSTPFYDESVKAYMSYITYVNLRKLK